MHPTESCFRHRFFDLLDARNLEIKHVTSTFLAVSRKLEVEKSMAETGVRSIQRINTILK